MQITQAPDKSRLFWSQENPDIPKPRAGKKWRWYLVMWMQQGRICILGKIVFSIDNENAGKNAQVKLYFMTELK